MDISGYIGNFFYSGHWLFVAFMAPIFWALVNVIDVYFVKGVYDDELDGTIISGLFQIIPLGVIFFFSETNVSSFFGLFGEEKNGNINISLFFDKAIPLFFIGGMVFSLASYFYFRALFRNTDASLIEIINNFSVILVPIFAFFLLGEKLSTYEYAGMGITLAGGCILSLSSGLRGKATKGSILAMLASVTLLSLSMVIENQAYDDLGKRIANDAVFWPGFTFFSLGIFSSGLIFAITNRRNPFLLIRKHWAVFLVAEGLSFLGTLFSQRAINISPSVSYVSTIESFVPVFILIFSLAVIFYLKFAGQKINGMVGRIYNDQLMAMDIKLLSVIIMAIGIYIIS